MAKLMWTHRRSGLIHQRGQNDHRDPYERDRTRVIHCPAFRRLQRKTQILGTDEGDFHRTRLTHSLEVSSIGFSIIRNLSMRHQDSHILMSLLPNNDLITVICLLHDIGHPPFGHGGEVALNYMMRDHNGFEGNAQTLRLLTKIENSYGEDGLDLTRRSLLGVLKYPVAYEKLAVLKKPEVHHTPTKSIRINDWLPPKGYYTSEQPEIDWLLYPFKQEDKQKFQQLKTEPTDSKHGSSQFYSFDCSIMDVADDIAYGVHDLEDAIHLKLIQRSNLDTKKWRELLSHTPLAGETEQLMQNLFAKEVYLRKQSIGEMVNYFITATEIAVTDDDFSDPILKHNITLKPEARAMLDYLIKVIYKHVINSQEARTFEFGGQTVIQRLFEAISSNPSSLLDMKNRALYKKATDDNGAYRVICDYIACMTDEYAYRMHERLFGFNTRTIFERL